MEKAGIVALSSANRKGTRFGTGGRGTPSAAGGRRERPSPGSGPGGTDMQEQAFTGFQ